MPIGRCQGCNRLTNSATSNWWDITFSHPTECYAAHNGKKWVKGCAFDKLGKKDFRRKFAESVINKK